MEEIMENVSVKMSQIVEAAKILFTRYGYKKVSMDEIAREANVVKSTIYQYFKDKDELFKYFIYDEINKMKDMVEDIDKSSNSVFDKIHKTIYQLLMYRKNQQFLVTIIKEAESSHYMSVCESVNLIDKCILEYVEKKLKVGIEKKVIRNCNAKVMSFVLFKAYVALAIDWEKENESLNEKEISDNISLFLKTGLII
jgi:AcrR family transcriptional regulator